MSQFSNPTSILGDQGYATVRQRLQDKAAMERQAADAKARQELLQQESTAAADRLKTQIEAQSVEQIRQIDANKMLQDDQQDASMQILERELLGREILDERQRQGQSKEAALDRQLTQQTQQAQIKSSEGMQEKTIKAQADQLTMQNQARMEEMKERARLESEQLKTSLLHEREMQQERLSNADYWREKEQEDADRRAKATIQLEIDRTKAAAEALSQGRDLSDQKRRTEYMKMKEQQRIHDLEAHRAKISNLPAETKTKIITNAGMTLKANNDAYAEFNTIGETAAGILGDPKFADDVMDTAMKNYMGPLNRMNADWTGLNAGALTLVSNDIARRIGAQVMPSLRNIADTAEEASQMEDALKDVIDAAYKSAPGTTQFLEKEHIADNLAAMKEAVDRFLKLTGPAGAGLLQTIGASAEAKVLDLKAKNGVNDIGALIGKGRKAEPAIVFGGLANIAEYVQGYKPMTNDEFERLLGAAASNGDLDMDVIEGRLLSAGWDDQSIKDLRANYKKYTMQTQQLQLYDEEIRNTRNKIDDHAVNLLDLNDQIDLSETGYLTREELESLRRFKQNSYGDE